LRVARVVVLDAIVFPPCLAYALTAAALVAFCAGEKYGSGYENEDYRNQWRDVWQKR